MTNSAATVLVFGATGTAGSGIVESCLESPAINEVRAIVRRRLPIAHPKLRSAVHADYMRFDAVRDAFMGVDACLYALGISVRQVSGEAEYRLITYDFALAAAHALKSASPNATFHFVSGGSTDVNSRQMWARVKGETERDLAKVMSTVCWRPGFIDSRAPTGPRLYRAMRPVFRLLSGFQRLYVANTDIGLAMIEAVTTRLQSGVLENVDIRRLADRRRAIEAGMRMGG